MSDLSKNGYADVRDFYCKDSEGLQEWIDSHVEDGWEIIKLTENSFTAVKELK